MPDNAPHNALRAAVSGQITAGKASAIAEMPAPHVRREPITFEILFYSGGTPHAPNRVIGRHEIRCIDLTQACQFAGRLFAGNNATRRRLPSDVQQTLSMAQGFYVRSLRDRA